METYPQQQDLAKDIYDSFCFDDVLFATLVAPPQWGKTGVITELIRCAIMDRVVEPSHIFIITGMNDLEWNSQTRSRLPLECTRNIFHRGTIHKLVEQWERDGVPSNSLVIFDECHIASVATHKFATQIQKMGILDISVLRERHIRLFQTSATPVHTLVDATAWGPFHKMFVASCLPEYIGFDSLMLDQRIRPLCDLRSKEQVKELMEWLLDRWTYQDPKYHIIRLNIKRSHDEEDIITEVSREYDILVVRHNSYERIQNIDTLLARAPEKHTLILIKGFWRAAKTLDDTHLGVCHETQSGSKDFNAEVQGLAGRLCGYNKRMGATGPVICCKREILEEYVCWFCNRCDYTRVHYSSASLRSRNGCVRAIPSMVHPSRIRNIDTEACSSSTGNMDVVTLKRNSPSWVHKQMELTEFLLYLGEDQMPSCPKDVSMRIWSRFQVPVNVVYPTLSYFCRFPRIKCGFDVYFNGIDIRLVCISP